MSRKPAREPRRKPRREIDALYAQIYARPGDDGLRLVLADALLELGDPRGELIALQCQASPTAQTTAREAALLRKHATAWLAPLAAMIRTQRLRDPRGKPRFRRGFLAVATVEGRSVDSPA